MCGVWMGVMCVCNNGRAHCSSMKLTCVHSQPFIGGGTSGLSCRMLYISHYSDGFNDI